MRKFWTDKHIEDLKEFYPHNTNAKLSRHWDRTPRAIMCMAYKLGLTKVENTGQFKKEQSPWNKGKIGYMGANKTSFKKGNLPHNHKGGILIQQDNSGKLYKYFRRDKKRILLHRFLYEKKHGKLDNLILVCKGDTLNCSPDNWEAITRQENISRNLNREKQSEGLKKAWEIRKLRQKYGMPQKRA